MKLSAAIPGPSSLNFLGGLSAGTGINMLTSVSTGLPDNVSAAMIGLDSLLWVVAAGFLTWAARILEDAEREAQLILIGRRITDEERQEIWAGYRTTAGRRALPAFVLAILSAIVAVLLLPGLISWHQVM
jgi:hypothetical protein